MPKHDDTPLRYPDAPRGDVVDDYHGVPIADPYRWLEDPDSPETRAWIDAENRLTERYLDQIPERPAIRARLERVWDYEKYDVPFARGGRTFYFLNDGLRSQAVLYAIDSEGAEPRVLLDPNLLSEDGTVALATVAPSEDGTRLVYGVSRAGSDWEEWRVRDVETGEDRGDELEFIKFSGAAWRRDGEGFFYGRYDAPAEETKYRDPNYFQKLYYHRLGTAQAEDVLVYERPDRKEWGFGPEVSEDGRYLVITVWRGSGHESAIFYKDLDDPAAGVVELVSDFDAGYAFLGNDGPDFYFRTDAGAPRGRVVALDARAPGAAPREIFGEREETLQRVELVGDRFVALYLAHARSRVRLYWVDGADLGEVALPGVGTAWGFGGRRATPVAYYGFTNPTTPARIYRYDAARNASEVFRAPRLAFDPEAFEVKQVFCTSRDGTRVPMTIAHRRGLALDGNHPTYLYGYGGFNVALTPTFSANVLVWMEMGGVFAQANLRGGGEYGERWHKAGTRLDKQNVFDDFIAAAEWLVAEGYTSSARLAIGGGSNGGLLVGACLTQRPGLFGAAMPAVGVFDMLRFHKFTIGWGWVSDYGSSDDPEEFEALLAYSPLHAVRHGVSYPPTLITTGDHDDRVVPAHSFKFAAALQAAQAGTAPILIRIDTRAGHGAGKPTAKIIDEAADRWSFLVRALRMHLPAANLPGA